MVDYVPSEKGTPIRYPSTALLCVDSYDRVNPYLGIDSGGSTPFNCQFVQKANILNGFFTRLSTTEIVLDWAEPNIDEDFNDFLDVVVDVPITGNVSASGTSVSITTNNYFKVGNSVRLSGLTGAGAVLNGEIGVVSSLTGSNPSTAVSLSLVSAVVAAGSYGGTAEAILNVTIPPAFYNVANLLDYIVCNLDGQTGTGMVWTIDDDCGDIALKSSQSDFTISPASTLANQLGFQTIAYDVPSIKQYIESPDIRLYRFLDFTCSQITYAQDVKDATTNPVNLDLLARFYMAYDESPQYDKYGFPILLGYNATSIRRAYNFPKQIRWDSGLPIGNLVFQIYGGTNLGNNTEQILPWDSESPTKTNWMMTIQVSEV
jgi:hypothetical protein